MKPPWKNSVRCICGVTLLSAISTVLTGCALHKPPGHSAVTAQALPKATPLPPRWNANSDGGNVGDDWVKTFHDPALEKIVSEAIANNLDLRESAARVAAAQQGVAIVSSQLKPRIGAILGA